MCLQYKSFEITVGKGEIIRNEQILLFPKCFLSVWRSFHQMWNSRLRTLLLWKGLKFVVSERVKPRQKTERSDFTDALWKFQTCRKRADENVLSNKFNFLHHADICFRQITSDKNKKHSGKRKKKDLPAAMCSLEFLSLEALKVPVAPN